MFMDVSLNIEQLSEAYAKARNRILFLDYDGTLVPFRDRPEKSFPGNDTRALLKNLSSDPKNRVYIISGRTRDFRDSRFRGIHLGLIAEHGFMVREPDGPWIARVHADTAWKREAVNRLSPVNGRFPGSFIEEKESSVVFHFRTAGKKAEEGAVPLLREIVSGLQICFPGLELLEGNKVIEIKPGNFNKGDTAAFILRKGNYDFILAAGDDVTDEQLFAGLGDTAITIKIGYSDTSAKYRIASRVRFLDFLKGLS